MGHYKIGKDRKAVVVSSKMHAFIRLYAKKANITMVEATFNLLCSGIAQLFGHNFRE